jgi:TM2 domain-containing membrane protein YozV
MTFPNTGYQNQGADPFTAAMLSLVPGLGQIYNGEKRKGVLFLEVAAINYFLLWLVICTSPLVDGLKSFGSVINAKPNTMLIAALRQAHLGSPLSLIIIGLVSMFLAYAVRDAYDRAAHIRRKKIYPEHVIEFTEATSGSYLFHFAAMVTCFILALFFLVPKSPVAQITEITFIRNAESKRPVRTEVASTVNSQDAGRHRLDKPVGTASGARTASAQPNSRACQGELASNRSAASQSSASSTGRPAAPAAYSQATSSARSACCQSASSANAYSQCALA